MKLVAVILTLNEERHLARCIASVQALASEIVVADCFSTDATGVCGPDEAERNPGTPRISA